MRAQRMKVATVVFLVMSVIAAQAKKPKTTFDKSTDFSQFRTYAWAPGTSAPDIIVDQVILSGVEGELERAGLRKTEAESADLIVRYDVAGGSAASSAATDPTYASRGGLAPVTTTSVWTVGGSIDTLTKGSLCIRLLDRAKQQIVWTSVAEEGLDDRRARRVKQVSEVVANMFKGFPRKK